MNLFDVYPLFDVEIVRGEGCHVYDAIKRQAEKLVFYSNSVHNSLQVRLAEKLGKACGYDDYSLFLINSGAEANENAMKLASFHTGKGRIVAFGKAFHGRTSLAVEATDNPKIVAPVNANHRVTFVPFGDAAEREMAKGDVAAVIVEGIQGVGGINVPADGFWHALRAACDRHNVVMIADEIQSGYGRSGKFFAHQHSGVRADIVTMAKGIANGFPMGALIINPEIKPSYGMLGTTFGGNHLACAAAIAVLDIFEQENLVDNAARMGDYLMAELKKIDGIKEVRGKGLMIGIEFDRPVKELRSRLLFEQHVFTGASGQNVIRLLPPLVLTKDLADEFIKRFKAVL